MTPAPPGRAGFSAASVIPEPVRAWARDHVTTDITAITRVGGGLTDTIWAVSLLDRDPMVLRYVDPDRWGEIGRRHVLGEALACRLMEPCPIPTPRLVASDPTGARGAYANLTTWLPGEVRLGPLDDDALRELARAAAAIHALPVPLPDRPPAYVSWAPDPPEIPTWTRRPELWRRAIALYAQPAPATAYGLIHRDFHPGNVLWVGNALTGLIDWTETAWGPADLDVSHAISNFAMLHDRRSAEVFVRSYAAAGGRRDPDPRARRHWQIVDILGFLPDPAVQLAAILVARPDLDAAAMRAGLEDLLARTVSSTT